jgi:HEAT repeat protein
MHKLFEDISTTVDELAQKSVEELLLLVGDDADGCKAEALDRVLAIGLDAIYPILDMAVRNDDNADLRNGAMEVLVRFGQQAVPRLVSLLRDGNEEVRNFSAVMLGDIGSREPVSELVRALRDPEENVRHAAAEALGKIGDRAALVPLIDLLDEDFWQQFPAIVGIGSMRDRRGLPYLIRFLDHELLAQPAVEAIGKIGDPRALPILGGLISHPSCAIVPVLARAIYEILVTSGADGGNYHRDHEDCSLRQVITPEGVENLKREMRAEAPAEQLSAVVSLLGWLGELSSFPLMIRLLGENEYHDVVKDALVCLGPGVIDSLVKLLADDRERVRTVALSVLGELGWHGDATLLRPLLESKNIATLQGVLSFLKGKGEAVYFPDLERLLANGPVELHMVVLEILATYPEQLVMPLIKTLAVAEPSRRQAAAVLIGLRGKRECAGYLKSLLTDQDVMVRLAAVHAAAKMGGELVPDLAAALVNQDADVRDAAILALAELKETSRLPEILALLGNREETDLAVVAAARSMGSPQTALPLCDYLRKGAVARRVEYALIEAVGALKCRSREEVRLVASYLNHKDPDFRRLALHGVASMQGDGALTLIEGALSDPHWSVRVEALEVLGVIGAEQAIPRMVAALSDPDLLVKKKAVRVLGMLRSPKVVSPLIGQLVDPEIGNFAAEALLKQGRQALPWLLRVTTGSYPFELKERVIYLLGELGEAKSIATLLELLDDANPAIRLAAIDSLILCLDDKPLKKLSRLKELDTDERVQVKADLALKTLTMDRLV